MARDVTESDPLLSNRSGAVEDNHASASASDENEEELELVESLRKWGWKETKGLVIDGFPVSLGYLLQILIPTSNAFFVGHLSTTYLAGLTLGVMMANCTGIYVGFGAALALDTLLSQSVTSSLADKGDAFLPGLILQRGMLLMTMIAAPVGVFWFSVENVLLLLGQEPEVAKYAGRFCTLLLPGLLPLLWFECLKKYCQALGYMRPPFYVQVLTVPFHIMISSSLVSSIGFDGAPLALCITYALQFALLVAYIAFAEGFGRWGGLDVRALKNWWPMLRLAVPGVFLLCGEYWAYEIIALLAGLFGESELAAQSIVLLTLTCTYQIVFGTTIASGNRIGNLLGASQWRTARVVAYASFMVSIPLEIANIAFLLAVRPIWGRLFTDDARTAELVSQLLVAGAVIQIADGIVMWGGGVVRGVGWQEVGAEANMALYYLFGIPLGAFLAFKTPLGIAGLWVGLCTALYGVALILVFALSKIDWKDEARQARERSAEEPRSSETGEA
ncbi:MATE efflux family protein [Gonapodya prolifera JEL478]|uniref:MATE efflux family protein n=1 Tax=Gonapodya prolifera (strain JEL478) TaxID=1344416 RepID=A0A139AXK6_GONPJ|nr:MATE efflux family protein [Gonapodya prolifera JEL478]|eukprot:KXS21450.1 MATE efflux family protein [Gonapodya prolifera JEL478]